jgi:hypothetical protein
LIGPGAGFGMTPTTIGAISGDVAQLEEHRLCKLIKPNAVLDGVSPGRREPGSYCYLLVGKGFGWAKCTDEAAVPTRPRSTTMANGS